MRLLLITNDRDDNIDEILLVVPDDYDSEEVLADAQDHFDGTCSIVADVELGDEAKYNFSAHRMYVG